MKLADYLSKNGLTETAFAALIKPPVSQVTVNRYVKGKRFPDPEMIERIFIASGKKVTVADWYAQATEARAKAEQAA